MCNKSRNKAPYKDCLGIRFEVPHSVNLCPINAANISFTCFWLKILNRLEKRLDSIRFKLRFKLLLNTVEIEFHNIKFFD